MPIAHIQAITWFPDYPDGNVPPNTANVLVATVLVGNSGSAGYINTKLYSSVNGSDWSQVKNIARWFSQGEQHLINVYTNSPNASGTWHVAITVSGHDETEPSLPDPSQCP